MYDHIRRFFHIFVEIVELIMVVVVAIAIIIAVIGLFPHVHEYWADRADVHAFSHMMESILTIVIGTEFMKMLIKPTPDTVTETLIFVIARHMVVAETTPLMDLASVISICLLFLLRAFLVREKNHHTLAERFFTKHKTASQDDEKSNDNH